MSDYTILTDSACDISASLLNEWGVRYASLSFRFDNDGKDYLNDEMNGVEFYKNVRNGKRAKTAAVNVDAMKNLMESELEKGNDVLYIGFSSGLSATYNSGASAADELRRHYPDRKIYTVDSLAASAGEGLLLYLTVERKRAGASVDEAAAFASDTKLKICHWFTVDDLKYLKAGGRVSAATAVIGGMLGVKPIMHVDNDGHLIKRSTVRGRIKSIWALGDKFAELATDKRVFISHGDCEDEARLLKSYVEEKYGARVEIITFVGPVIGAHSGPGTMAIFFVGTHR